MLLLSAALMLWLVWRASAQWLNTPTTGITGNAPLPNVVMPPIPAQRPTAPHEVVAEDFRGTWTGKWDNTYAAQFTIMRGRGSFFLVLYEHEETPGQPMVQQTLRPTPKGRVLRMPRASVVMTLSETKPNTARADGSFAIGNSYHHIATLVRTDTSTPANWLIGEALTGPTAKPIVLDIKATVDGSDVLHLTQDKAVWEHKDFDLPNDVSVNQVPWDVGGQPTLEKTGLGDADFSTAKVLDRSGRDLVAMEKKPDGIDIYFDDSPPGASPYEIKIGLSRKEAARATAKPPSGNPLFLDVQGEIDGTDALTISAAGARWDHHQANWPNDVRVNGVPWNVLTNPAMSDVGLSGADFSSAQTVERSGRDALVVEKTNDSVTVYFDDDEGGTGHYHIRLRFDRR